MERGVPLSSEILSNLLLVSYYYYCYCHIAVEKTTSIETY